MIRALRSSLFDRVLESKSSREISERIMLKAIHTQLSVAAAKDYAEKSARKKFLLFGKPIEKMDLVETKYLPLRLCNIRIPTKHKDEYLEYSCLVTGDCRLVLIKKPITFADLDEDKVSKNRYKAYLSKDLPSFDSIEGTKGALLAEIPRREGSQGLRWQVFPYSFANEHAKNLSSYLQNNLTKRKQGQGLHDRRDMRKENSNRAP